MAKPAQRGRTTCAAFCEAAHSPNAWPCIAGGKRAAMSGVNVAQMMVHATAMPEMATSGCMKVNNASSKNETAMSQAPAARCTGNMVDELSMSPTAGERTMGMR